MTTIIQNWVCNKTGVLLNLDHKDVGRKLFDGFIYYKLIEFITPGSGSVKQPKFPVSSQFEALSNLEMLCPWLKILGVNHDPFFLKKISQRNKEACLRMLYEIYLRVEDRNHIYMVTKQREAYLLSKEENGFQVKKAPESQIDFVDTKCHNSGLLEDPLVHSKPLVLKYKYRKEKLLKKCKQESARRARKLALLNNAKFGHNDKMKINLTPPATHNEDVCIKRCESKKHVALSPEQMNLLNKKKRTLNMEKTKLKMFSSILYDLWSTFTANELEDFENTVRSKLLEQSSQEKQLSIKWTQLHTQYKNFFQQSIVTNEQTERPGPILADIYPYKKVDEKKRILELHSRLFEEVASKMERENLALCGQTAIDLVDYSTLKSEYWRAHEHDVPKYVEFLWKELFYKGLPIELEVNNHFNNKSSYDRVEGIKMHYLQTKIPDALLDVIVDCYLKQKGLWSSSNEPRSLNNFGFIIHTLLQNKYPLPPDIQLLKLPEFTIKVILADVQDPFVLNQMKELLEVQKVVLIDVNLFTNYCLEKFEEEKSYYDLFRNADFLEKFSDIVELVGFVPRYKNLVNKETQFPPADGVGPKHSYAGLLGKLAFEMLNEGECLDDVLLVAMLVEYLKTLEGKRGFVLAGYPTTQYQILLFEYFIMGKPLKTNIKKWDTDLQFPVNSGILLYLDSLIRRSIVDKDIYHEQSESQFLSSMVDYLNDSTEEEKLDEYDKEEQRQPHSQVTSPGTNKHRSLSHGKSFSTCYGDNVSYLASSEPWTYEDLNRFRTSKILPNPLAEWPNKDGISQTYIERFITICKGYNYVKSDRNLRKNGNKTFDYKKCKTTSQKTNYLRNNITGEQVYEQFDKFTKIYIWEFDVETLAFISKIILDLDVDLPTKEIKQSIVSFGRLVTKARENDNFVKPRDGLCDDIQYIPSPAYYDCKRLMGRSRYGKSTEGDSFSYTYDSENSDSHIYVQKPLPDKLQIAMASVWEQVEKSYLGKLRESLSKVLSIKSQWLPFKNYVSQMIKQSIQKSDERLQIVNNFQLMFNAVELFTRKDPNVKAELHFRVKELNDILLNLIEKKRLTALEVKNDLEDTQWVRNYILLLTNSYLRLLQHEIDRTVDSLQIVVDYYTSMLGLLPDTKILPKVDIKPILLEEDDYPFGKKKSKVSQSYSMSLKRSTSSVNDPSSNSSNFLSSGLNVIRGKIKSLQSFFSSVINPDKKQTADKKPSQARLGSTIQSVGKGTKTVSSKKLIKEKMKRKVDQSRSKSIAVSIKSLRATGNPYESPRNESRLSTRTKSIKRENSDEQILKDKIKTEWQNVVRMEIDRLVDIVALIEEKAIADIEAAVNTVNYLYEKFETDIEECYQKEQKALSNIRKIFSAAIEDEVPIQPLLVFDNDKFFIDKSNLLFQDIPPHPPESIEEETDDYKFKISQLEKLVTKLQNISPNSIMRETLGSILHAHFRSNEVPEQWKQLSKKQIDEILSFVYGRVDVVDWKVFVMFATDIPFPTVDDLLDLKKHFEQIDKEKNEIISKQQFYDTTLWIDRKFTPDLQGDLHLILSKLLMQKVFEVTNSELNYKEFLLFFCKSETNKEGFMKILEVLNDKGNLRRKDCAVHEVVPVDAIIVAKQEFDRILSNAFNVIDGIPVKTLPTDNYENIFASPHNEYLETEMILAKNWLTSPRTRISTCYESDPHFDDHVQSFEEYKNCLPLYERFREPIWYKCVHYKLALTIFMFALNLNFTSPDGLQRQQYIETRLKDLFKEKGVNNYIQAFHLYESKFMQEIFETSFFFKTCQLDVLLQKYTKDKSSHQK
ncbi:sperm flagellar protein 2-like [Cimex lectularius]|uniref:Calponin-homology (CH) domain-containing protein n=1 Tax=Cimex lectularius TaxID=79782 RepID=A0A8I6RSM3_CIMLE|nr:sperm flagellar protein 2-like [Cimex lectularius]XP_014249296.1 sperm flagellar protein 2-like [Cimex lectularius]